MPLNLSKRRLGPDNRLVSYRFFRHFAEFLGYILHHLNATYTEEQAAECKVIREWQDRNKQLFGERIASFEDLARKCRDSRWGTKSPDLGDYNMQRHLRKKALCGDGAGQIRPYLKKLAVYWTFGRVVLFRNHRIAPNIIWCTFLEQMEGGVLLLRLNEVIAKQKSIASCRSNTTQALVADNFLHAALCREAERILSARVSRDQQKRRDPGFLGRYAPLYIRRGAKDARKKRDAGRGRWKRRNNSSGQTSENASVLENHLET